MLSYGVGHYVRWMDVPQNLRGNILHSFMFIKDKNRPDGTYDQTRARLVCNGAQQKNHMFDLISSATVGLTSVFLAFNIATRFKCKIRTYDIVAAFLHAQFKPQDAVTYIKVNKEITAIWITIDPTASQFVDSKGELLLQLDKFIYGLKQAPVKWQQLLTKVLLKLGYRQLIHDDCVMIRNQDKDFSMICLHVDDILLVSNTDYMFTDLTKGLTEEFGPPTSADKASSYIGMHIQQSENRSSVKLTQEDLVHKIQARYPNKGPRKPSSPTAEDFLEEPPTDSHLAKLVDNKEFLGIVMQLMYLARLTRPDILLPVTYLATRSNRATVKDMESVQRIVDYLGTTPTLGITINCKDLQLVLRADASHGIHTDGKGHTGFMITLGSTHSYVHARSGKQRLISHSSTEAEVIAATDCIKMGTWVRNIIITPLQPMILHQDNMSAQLLMTEPSKARRSKHILMKTTYVRELVTTGTLQVVHIDTEDLTPDILTKPKQGHAFRHHRSELLGDALLPDSKRD
jgi:hypothetical protein